LKEKKHVFAQYPANKILFSKALFNGHVLYIGKRNAFRSKDRY